MEQIESPPPLPIDAWVTLRTAGARLEVSERQIRRLIRDGQIEARTLGKRCVRVRWASCLALMQADTAGECG